jgi:hypothetical protein
VSSPANRGILAAMSERPNYDDLLDHRRQVNEHTLRTWETLTEARTARQEAAIKLSSEALKGLILINGAAGIALMAFISQSWGKAGGFIPLLAEPLRWFGGGAFAGALAAGVGYSAQLLYVDFTPESRLAYKLCAWAVHTASVLVAVAGFYCFFHGAMLTADLIGAAQQKIEAERAPAGE